MTVKNINAKTLQEWLDKKEAVLVDVREPSEYSAKNINGSVLIPLGSISCEVLPDCLDKKLVINCHAGKRGGLACEKLLAQNPGLQIYNLEGGISAWEEQGFKVQTSDKDSSAKPNEFCSIK